MICTLSDCYQPELAAQVGRNGTAFHVATILCYICVWIRLKKFDKDSTTGTNGELFSVTILVCIVSFGGVNAEDFQSVVGHHPFRHVWAFIQCACTKSTTKVCFRRCYGDARALDNVMLPHYLRGQSLRRFVRLQVGIGVLFASGRHFGQPWRVNIPALNILSSFTLVMAAAVRSG